MPEPSGGEVELATSLVRWAPGTRFQPHSHPGGEEILVLDGVFQDEHGDYPAGSWLRNPPGSIHSPFRDQGHDALMGTLDLPFFCGVVVEAAPRSPRQESVDAPGA